MSASVEAGPPAKRAPAPPDRTSAARHLAGFIPSDAWITVLGQPWAGQPWAAEPPGTAPTAVQPGHGGETASRPEQGGAAALLTMLGASGWIGREGRVYADAAAALPLLGRHRWALALLDLSVQPGRRDRDFIPESVRLDRMQSALILETHGRNEDVLAQIARLVQRYTNNQDATIEDVLLGDDRIQRLVDRRLPDWCVIEWGPLAEHFVVAVGRGAFEKIRDARAGRLPRLADDGWFAAAHRRVGGDQALFEWCVDFARLRGEIQRIAGERVLSVLDAMDVSGVERDVWAVAVRDRAVTLTRCFRSRGADRMRVYSAPAADARTAARIPPGARRYGVLRGATGWLFRRAPQAWVRARYYRQLANVERWWRELQAGLNLDVERQILANLGDEAIICDYPPHPLGIPIAVTIAVAVDDADAVRGALDPLLNELARQLDEAARNEQLSLLRMRLKRDADGVWYLQAGLLGPGLCVTDRYIVISWSPQAVRQARRWFSDQVDAPASAP